MEQVTDDLAKLVASEVPDCCFVQLYYSKPFPTDSKPILPLTVDAILSQMTNASIDDKLAALSVSDLDIENLAQATTGQRECTIWHSHRTGRITATNMHAVYTKMAKISTKPDGEFNCERLVKVILGQTKNVTTAAMKHGISMEPHAASRYTSLMKSRHQKFHATHTGLVLCKDYPFLAASPDLLVNCTCCGQGLCEIKSPYKFRHLAPASGHIDYLEMVDGQCHIKKNSNYYFQIQGQMGVTGLKYCDLFVFTMHGYHLERISFSDHLWGEICTRCRVFWCSYIAPKIGEKRDTSSSTETDTAESEFSDSNPADDEHGYCRPKVKRIKTCPLTNPPYPSVCLCGICHASCTSHKSHYSDDSIQCSGCMLWYHHICVNVTEQDDTWLCESCLLLQV